MASQVTLTEVRPNMTRGLIYNSTSSAVVVPVDTVTPPALVDASGDPSANTVYFAPTYEWVKMQFWAIGAADQAFTVGIFGWHIMEQTSKTDLYMPFPLFTTLTCTPGTSTGVASSAKLNTELNVDTIVATTTSLTVNEHYYLLSTTNNTTASIVFKTFGAKYITASFAKGSNTSVNLAYASINR